MAPKHHVLLSADYSQIELRILAHLSRDELLLQSFARDEDVHARTAAEVFGVATDEVTADQRRIAKTVNFGVIYGQTDWGLARQLGIPKREAGEYIQAYFAHYAGVQRFMEQVVAQAREEGIVRTLLGRKRAVSDLGSRQRGPRGYAERIAR